VHETVTNNNASLRHEIVESQKSQTDFLKWKLIAVAAVASAAFGFPREGTTTSEAQLLLCLVPLICAYVDLISLHLMARIITIGVYLKLSGDQYEQLVFDTRVRSASNPFVFEAVALHGSSFVFNAILLGLGFALTYTKNVLDAYKVFGTFGLGVTALVLVLYSNRTREVIRVAEQRFAAGARAARDVTRGGETGPHVRTS